MVDPIDGTRDFVRGETGFVVMIGLAIDGRPAVGAVGHPLTGHVYAGAVGAGAWREDAAGARTPLHTSTLSQPPDIRLVASKSHRTARIDAVKRALQITDEMNVGSIGLKIGLVSRGAAATSTSTRAGARRSGTPAGRRRSSRGAGGRMTDVDGKPLVYDQPDLYNRRGLVASNGPLHDFVIDDARADRRDCRSRAERGRLAAGDHHARDAEGRALDRRARVEIVADRVDPLPELVEVRRRW